jgi:hypothetical protein
MHHGGMQALNLMSSRLIVDACYGAGSLPVAP